MSNEKNKSIVASGIFPSCGSNKTLFHETVCVPKDSCLLFNLSPHEDNDYYDDLSYVISMDDAMYRNSRWDTVNRGYNFETNDELTLLGKCTQSDCPPQEDLIEVSFSTPVEYVKNGINQTGIYSSDSPGYGLGIDWALDYSDHLEILRIRSVHKSQYFVESVYELDTKYRVRMCIPSVNCDCSDTDNRGERVCVPSEYYDIYPSQQSFDVRMSVDAPVVDYNVKQNGVQIQSNIRPENTYRPTENLVLVSSLGGEQCKSLSGGAIAGIVIGSVVGLLALAGGGYMLYKKKHQSN